MSTIRPLSTQEWIGLTAAFVVVVALGRSLSASSASAKTATLGARETAAAGKTLVTLIGADHVVRVDSSRGEPVYTVLDRSGKVLAAGLRQDDLASRFPSLRIDSLHAAGPDEAIDELTGGRE
ncbi:MAG: hypothetical protein K2Y21_08110 [Phycisphaerales bacterium]|nr:hypothetical protein [Phycisphaerales bacterium]